MSEKLPRGRQAENWPEGIPDTPKNRACWALFADEIGRRLPLASGEAIRAMTDQVYVAFYAFAGHACAFRGSKISIGFDTPENVRKTTPEPGTGYLITYSGAHALCFTFQAAPHVPFAERCEIQAKLDSLFAMHVAETAQ